MGDYYYFPIRCPHCKKDNDLIFSDGDGLTHKYKCEKCKKKFIVEMTFRVKKV